MPTRRITKLTYDATTYTIEIVADGFGKTLLDYRVGTIPRAYLRLLKTIIEEVIDHIELEGGLQL